MATPNTPTRSSMGEGALRPAGFRPGLPPRASAPRRPPRQPVTVGRVLKILVKLTLFFAAASVLLAGGVALVTYEYFSQGLPRLFDLSDYRPALSTRIYAADGSEVADLYDERRVLVPFERIPPIARQAFIAAEDAEFYRHPGIDMESILRAFVVNLRRGQPVQGGSTITQQIVKSLVLTRERTYERKIKEMILAYRLEKRFTKDQIFWIYLNEIYLGQGAYGVQAASRVYFGKDVADLDLAQASLLAGLPQAPSRYNPFEHLAEAKMRQRYVLDQMVKSGAILPKEAEEAHAADLGLVKPKPSIAGPSAWFVEHVRRTLIDKYGSEKVMRGGLVVETTLDPNLQRLAEEAVRKGVLELDKRMGWRGPKANLDKAALASRLASIETGPLLKRDEIVEAVVTGLDPKALAAQVRAGEHEGIIPIEEMSWAAPPDPAVTYLNRRIRNPREALKVGDVIDVRVLDPGGDGAKPLFALEQKPAPQGALLAMETDTGYVRAMIGGFDYAESEFNRAVQSMRQPGSSFKPIIYATAVEKGYGPNHILIDSPIVEWDVASAATGGWKPHNYDEKFKGAITMRQALVESRNIPTIKLLKEVGLNAVVDMARRLGIQAPLDKTLALALGASGLPLVELTTAYATIANNGVKNTPIFVREVVDRDGAVLAENTPLGEQTISPQTAFIMTSLLEAVVQEGTGRRAQPIGRPAAGKTGTTNDFYDAWFMGFTPDFVCGTWVGLDDRRSLGRGETGSKAAIPIWLDFMEGAHEGKPIRPFLAPDGVRFAQMDARTGLSPLPGADSRHVRTLPFLPGTEPVVTGLVPTEGGGLGEEPEGGEFFHLD